VTSNGYSPEMLQHLQVQIGDKVRAFKKQHRMTNAQFGARCGLASGRVARITQGRCDLRLRDLIRVSMTLQVAASQLLNNAGL
jgi:transcriptional regulator with XRE-family HTH domain